MAPRPSYRRGQATTAITITLALLLLGACGAGGDGRGTGTISSTSSGWTVLASPAKGGIDGFTWALPFEATSLDPIKSWSYPENTILANLCESVVHLTPELKLEPGLASRVDTSDPTKVVLTIRDGVTFWDGSPMTAEDVAFSLNRNLQPDLGGYFAPFWRNVDSVVATGSSEVTITLKQVDVLFWKILSMASGAVSKKAYLERQGKAYGTPKGGLMCTGPFQLERWTPGQSVVITRRDGYWNPQLRPKAARVELRAVADQAALTNALLTGEIDGTFITPVAAIDRLEANGAGTLYRGESTLAQMLVPRLDGPLGDVRIRKALSMALDRTVISQRVWDGAATPVSSIATPTTWGYAQDVFAKAYQELGSKPTADLEAAKALVRQAGVPTRTITVWSSAERREANTTANYIADVGRQLGLKMKVRTVPIQEYATWAYDPAVRARSDLALTVWWTDVAEPLQALWPILEPGGVSNYNRYSNPAAVQLLTRAFAEADDTARARLVTQAQQVLFTEGMMWIPLVNTATLTWMSKRITGGPVGLPGAFYTPWAAYVGAP
ncbi:MAG TPA: ABC transporter substrate-binding protein [Propionibacteriaceae bacterium]|nr:ABC transporter substrate-binding protein [Propionibacteriaceae bacterium]